MKYILAFLRCFRCLWGDHDLYPHIPWFGYVCKRCGYWKREL